MTEAELLNLLPHGIVGAGVAWALTYLRRLLAAEKQCRRLLRQANGQLRRIRAKQGGGASRDVKRGGRRRKAPDDDRSGPVPS